MNHIRFQNSALQPLSESMIEEAKKLPWTTPVLEPLGTMRDVLEDAGQDGDGLGGTAAAAS